MIQFQLSHFLVQSKGPCGGELKVRYLKKSSNCIFYIIFFSNRRCYIKDQIAGKIIINFRGNFPYQIFTQKIYFTNKIMMMILTKITVVKKMSKALNSFTFCLASLGGGKSKSLSSNLASGASRTPIWEPPNTLPVVVA